MVIYDYRTQALFSSTLFSTLHTGEDIFAKKEHISEAAHYLSEYCGSQVALDYAQVRLAPLKISYILPQHGVMVQEHLVSAFLDILSTAYPGNLLETATRPIQPEHTQAFLQSTADVSTKSWETGCWPISRKLLCCKVLPQPWKYSGISIKMILFCPPVSVQTSEMLF